VSVAPLAVVVVVVLIALAVRVTQMPPGTRRSTPRHIAASATLAALFSVGLVGYFLAEDILGGDAHSHTAQTWLMSDILTGGEVPIWTNRWYLGYPIGLYYGFLYHLVTGLVASVTGMSPVLSTKVCLLFLHAASGLVAFRYFSFSGATRAGALFGALFYTYSFQHVGMMMLAGALPLSVCLLVVPAAALVMERVIVNRPARVLGPALQAAVLGSIAVFAHFQYSLYGALALGLLGGIRAGILLARRDVHGALVLARFLSLTAVLAGCLTAWFVGPFILEKRHLLLGNDLPLDNLEFPGFRGQ
jgi:uncharacterized membrane protein